jgi:DNA-binding transcriptional MerR regulator
MGEPVPPVEIPDKAAFKPAEVCELAQIPSYVLRTWENEFKDLGVAPKPGSPRTYRRRDVELAIRIKALVFGEHLTLAGVRRRLEQEHLLTPVEDEELGLETRATAAAVTPAPVKETIALVKEALRSLLQTLARDAVQAPVPSAAPAKPALRPVKRAAGDATPALPGLGDDAVAERQGAAQAVTGETAGSEGGRRRRAAKS